MFELTTWLELVLVGAATNVPLWLCAIAALCVAIVCVTLVIGGEEEDVSRRAVAARARAGKEESAQRAAVALRGLLLEIKHEDDRRDVEQAVRIALLRSEVIEADE